MSEFSFRPTDEQSIALKEAQAENDHEKYRKLYNQFEKEHDEEVKKIVEREVNKRLSKKNEESKKAIFDKFRKENPDIDFDIDNLRDNLPAKLVKDYDENKISTDAFLMKAVGVLRVIQGKKSAKTENETAEGSEEADSQTQTLAEADKNEPNLNSASGGGSPGNSGTPLDDKDYVAFGGY